MHLQYYIIPILALTFKLGFSWPVLPEIPSGQRSQFLILDADGSYNFGYDTGEGLAAKQVSDPSNQVYGLYFYRDGLGRDVEVKYTAGTQGFVPTEQKNGQVSSPALKSVGNTEEVFPSFNNKAGKLEELSSYEGPDDLIKGDGSYAFAYSADNVHREESADVAGNVKGRYSYKDDAGNHDLSYEARDETGFLVTGGNLAKPNGLRELQEPGPDSAVFYSLPFDSAPKDSSYSFEYSTPLHSRQEIGDAKGTVYGRYSFVNEAGTHDLRYVAGSDTGFLPIGGSLLEGQSAVAVSRSSEEKHDIGQANVEKVTTDVGSPSYSYVVRFDEDLKKKQTQDLGAQNSLAAESLTGGHDFSYVAGGVTTSTTTPSSLKSYQSPNNDGSGLSYFKSKSSGVSGQDQIVPSVIVYGYLPVNGNQRYGYVYDAL